MRPLYNFILFGLRKAGKGLHGLRILGQSKAEADGQFRMGYCVHLPSSEVFQVCCWKVDLQIVPAEIGVDHGIGVRDGPFLLRGLLPAGIRVFCFHHLLLLPELPRST